MNPRLLSLAAVNPGSAPVRANKSLTCMNA